MITLMIGCIMEYFKLHMIHTSSMFWQMVILIIFQYIALSELYFNNLLDAVINVDHLVHAQKTFFTIWIVICCLADHLLDLV